MESPTHIHTHTSPRSFRTTVLVRIAEPLTYTKLVYFYKCTLYDTRRKKNFALQLQRAAFSFHFRLRKYICQAHVKVYVFRYFRYFFHELWLRDSPLKKITY